MKRNKSSSSQYAKIKRVFSDFEWPLLASAMIFSLILGTIGFHKSLECQNIPHTIFDSLYLSFSLIPMNSGGIAGCVDWELGIARWSAPLVAAFTALKALLIVFDDQRRNFKLRFMKDHTIICGLGRKGVLLARDFIENGEDVVIIERDEENDYIGQCKELGAIILLGDGLDPQMLLKAKVDFAKYLVVVTGDDGTNAEIAVIAQNLKRKGNKSITCIIHLVDPRLSKLLKKREVSSDKDEHFKLVVFNIYEQGALALLRQFYPFQVPDRLRSSKNNRLFYNIVIVGLGNLGENLLIQSVKIWSALPNKLKLPLQFTILDDSSEEKIANLYEQYPSLRRMCEIVPYQVSFPLLKSQLTEILKTRILTNPLTNIYICMDKNIDSLTNGMILTKQIQQGQPRVVVQMSDDVGLAKLFPSSVNEDNKGEKLYSFGLLNQTCRLEYLLAGVIESLSKAIHQKYIFDQELLGNKPTSNPSMAPWSVLPENLRDSNREMAESIAQKLKKVGYTIDVNLDFFETSLELPENVIEKMAEEEHVRWYNERISQGWIYGEEKNIELKINPDLIPWAKLDEMEKEKNRQEIRQIPNLLSMVGLKIVPLQE